MIKQVFISSIILSITANLYASQDNPKQALKTNGQLIYQKQKQVDNFSEMFKNGDFYGRLRNNNFYFEYNKPDSNHETQLVSGIGASMVYKSAIFKGFDFDTALYASQSYFDAKHIDNVAHLKASKDTLSRFEYVNTGSKSMAVIGQANIGYTVSKTNLRVGRQLVETFYTRSNDTKMIPNSFDGVVLRSHNLAKTNLTIAYLYKQKLRDHTSSHSVLMFGDANSSSSINPQWSENDDSAMHKGLTYSRLKAYGKDTDAPLIVLDGVNKSIKNLKINFSSYFVPQLLSQVMGEFNYTLPFDGFSITSGFRYIRQFDNGAGKVGGASIKNSGLDGYKDKNSLDSGMIGAKIVTKMNDYRVDISYTGVFDKSDLVTPWRGFPTGGYTRSMGMYNWRANVKSYRIQLIKGANKKAIYTKPFIQTSILYIDGDKKKAETDSILYYAGIVQNIPQLENLQYRLRVAYRNFIGDSSSVSDYIDSRFELNYLF